MNLLRVLAISLLLQSAAPVVVDKVMPAYPPLARAAQIEGSVQISVTVGPDGKVRAARIISSSNPLLLTGAIDAVRQWIFQPSDNGGVVTVEIPYTSSGVGLTPSGDVITGRVLDPNGQPMVSVPITASKFVYSFGRRSLSAAGNATTDDRGIYRILNMPPGNYLVTATYRPPANALAVYRENYALNTYFPGTSRFEDAGIVTIEKGKETTANFNIATMTPVVISGTIVVLVPTGSTPRFRTSFVYKIPHTTNATDLSSEAVTASINANTSDYAFEFRRVLPGTYDLFALFLEEDPTTGTISTYSGRTLVEAGSNREGVTISVHKGVELKGRIMATSFAPASTSSITTVSYGRKDNSISRVPVFESATTSVTPDGSFQFSDVPPGRIGLSKIGNLPADSYLAAVQVGKEKLDPDAILNVGTESLNDIQILIANDGGSIRGAVLNSVGRPAAVSTLVSLIPSLSGRTNSLLYKRVRSGPDGSFTIRGIAPGEYKIFAFEGIPLTAESADENPDFLSRFEDRGTTLRIAAGEAISDLKLPVIPATSP